MTFNGIAAVVLGYLLGSFPSAYIVGRLTKGVDMREVGDGRIGPAAAFRKLGIAEGMIVGFMDFSKGAAAAMLAREFDVPLMIVLLAGLAAVVGHNWSIFQQLRGGLGASASYGVLAWLVFWQFLTGLGIAAIVYLVTRKSGLGTVVLFTSVSAILLLQNAPLMLVAFPIFLSLPMVVKRLLVERKRASGANPPKNYPLAG